MCFSPCSVFLTDKNVCCQLWFEKTLCKLDQPLSTSESSPFSMGILFCLGLNPSSITPHCLFKTAPLLFLTAQRASLSIGWCPCDHHGYLREGACHNGFEWWSLKYWATTQRFERHADLLPMRSYMAGWIASYGIAVNSFWQLIQLKCKGILPGSIEDITPLRIIPINFHCKCCTATLIFAF